MNAAERHARKQVLLARIAYARIELRRDVTLLKRSVQLPHMLRAVLGDRLGNGLAGTLKSTLMGGAAQGDWFGMGMALLRRYRLAVTILGGVAPLLRGGGRWRRVVGVAVAAGAGWLGWRVLRNRRDAPGSEPDAR